MYEIAIMKGTLAFRDSNPRTVTSPRFIDRKIILKEKLRIELRENKPWNWGGGRKLTFVSTQ